MKDLRKIFADICRGYTATIINGRQVFIKHISHFDQVDLDDCYEKYFAKAKHRGVTTLEERLAWLDAKKLWTKKDEAELFQQKSYVENLIKTQAKIFIKSQLEAHKKTIMEAQNKQAELIEKKESLLGMTCENYATKKMHSHYIFLSFWKDKELKKRLHEIEDFENLDDVEMNDLMSMYVDKMGAFSEKNIKSIVISNFFVSYFSNFDVNSQNFFGKPVVELTFNQLSLLFWASYFKSILQNHNVPDNIKNDPEKIEEYIAMSSRAKEVLDRVGKDDSYVGIVGASKEDLEYLGINSQNTLLDKAQKRGGISTTEEALR